MKHPAVSAVIFVLLTAGPVLGSELCGMMGGTCRNACSGGQYAESGVFEDCGEKQECCIEATPPAAGKQPVSAPDGEKAPRAERDDRGPER